MLELGLPGERMRWLVSKDAVKRTLPVCVFVARERK